MKRRDFVRTAGGATAAVAASAGATGTVAAQEVQPDWPSGASSGNVGSYTDARGQDSVTISVGAGSNGLAFDPTLVWVDEGTTITWEWTGAGGDHNVQTVDDGGPASLDSGDPVGEEGYTYEYETSSEDAGITHYHCVPHTAVGMHGGIAVGEDVATVETGGANTGWPEDIAKVGVPLHAHWVGISAMLGIGMTFVFTFYMLKYGESAHTGHGGAR
ncbi:halocyanin domain-containing protein [Halorubrum sp. Atlit-8R]|uniref:Halocyanin domain-containing protein n=1 Tax=Halorubrum salinarum TaxID=2739057 RepID=A0A7D3XZ37_9EURY|nr:MULTISPECIES: halocyanin domain-containing protein [Halorubrum]QKG91832.1 halocyanin domain-containing protein [Halorubrum salinarum]RLM71205.1 halocyanin domain-containing protein [Halorubrum sp. Atlit-9R]RLM72073.1 halocyanin domain-containing protein [Halorubrum sp. Atlit-9R]RLM82643.1 halocyanin domain-containing protein [Halorubrum sp. Atlit-8R]